MKRFWRPAVAAALISAGMLGSPAWGARITLKDGTELSGSVLDRTDDKIVIGMERSNVATVDGQPLPPPVAVGSVAPGFTATDLAGTVHSLESGKGQVTLLQFWATWCPYCRKDMAMMKQVAARYADRGLRIVTVSIDEDVQKLKTFVAEHAVPYPVISVTTAPDLPSLYETHGVPAYFLIDRQGLIAGAWGGSVTHGLPEGAQTELERRLEMLIPSAGTSAS